MNTNEQTIIVWFRSDLRIEDNPALFEAAKEGRIIPVFIWSPEEEDMSPGAATRWWLHQSIKSLTESLEKLGTTLVLRTGESIKNLEKLAKDTGAKGVYWNRRYEPMIRRRDDEIACQLRQAGLTVKTFKASLLAEPEEIENKSGLPFKVFTPFWKQCLKKLNASTPLPAPLKIETPKVSLDNTELSELNLEPEQDWAHGMNEVWTPGERGAASALELFINDSFNDYAKIRNFPNTKGTSRLSPHLKFGEISPRQIKHSLEQSGHAHWKESHYLSEIGWREFGYHLLYHFPHTVREPLRPPFNRFPWKENSPQLRSWQKGQTGYPLVDAGMRELWATGWMHNRVRMVVASFLVKHLLIHWRHGADWFWDTLVDADLASNTQGWQWTAGSGADAAPYFRIFNPTTQAIKFDPEGDYIRKWVPELRHMSAPDIFEPSKVDRGQNYPNPIVNHSDARDRALKAYEKTKA